MRIEIDAQERQNAEDIKALAKAHNKEDFGARAIAVNMPYETFKRALLDEVASKPLQFGTEMPNKDYSLARAIQGTA